MATIELVTIEVADPTAASRFYSAAFGVGSRVRVRASEAPTTGFRGFTLSFVVSRPATVASSSKKDTGPATGQIDEIVLQLEVADVAASKRFYVDRGFAVAKSYGRRYVELDTGPVKLTLNKRGALAKVAGVSADGTGSHRLLIGSDAGPFTDPDGFECHGPRQDVIP